MLGHLVAGVRLEAAAAEHVFAEVHGSAQVVCGRLRLLRVEERDVQRDGFCAARRVTAFGATKIGTEMKKIVIHYVKTSI